MVRKKFPSPAAKNCRWRASSTWQTSSMDCQVNMLNQSDVFHVQLMFAINYDNFLRMVEGKIESLIKYRKTIIGLKTKSNNNEVKGKQ